MSAAASFVATNPQGALLALMLDKTIGVKNVEELSKKVKLNFINLLNQKLVEEKVSEEFKEKAIKEFKPHGRKAFCAEFQVGLQNNSPMTPLQILSSSYVRSFILKAEEPNGTTTTAAAYVIENYSHFFPKIKEFTDEEKSEYKNFTAKFLSIYMSKKEIEGIAERAISATPEQTKLAQEIGTGLFMALNKRELLEEDLDEIVALLKHALTLPLEEMTDLSKIIKSFNRTIESVKVVEPSEVKNTISPERRELIHKYTSDYCGLFASYKERAKNTGSNHVSLLNGKMRAQLYGVKSKLE